MKGALNMYIIGILAILLTLFLLFKLKTQDRWEKKHSIFLLVSLVFSAFLFMQFKQKEEKTLHNQVEIKKAQKEEQTNRKEKTKNKQEENKTTRPETEKGKTKGKDEEKTTEKKSNPKEKKKKQSPSEKIKPSPKTKKPQNTSEAKKDSNKNTKQSSKQDKKEVKTKRKKVWDHFEIIEEYSNDLYQGESQVKQKGVHGYEIIEQKDYYVNGKIIDQRREVVKSQKRIDEIVLIGQKIRPHHNHQAAREMHGILNQYRQSQGTSDLIWSDKLYEAAKIRAKEASVNFSHTRPDGSSFLTSIDELGIAYSDYAENLSYGYGSAQSALDGWKGSAGHHRNMLKEQFSHMASAVYIDSDGQHFWVQLFITEA